MNKIQVCLVALASILFSTDRYLNAQENKPYKIEASEEFKNKAKILKIRGSDAIRTQKIYPQWERIDDESIVIEMNEAGPVLIQFNAVDTWNDGGSGTWYGIDINGQVKIQTLATGYSGQRVPVTLSTIENLPKGKTVLKTKWCTLSGGTSFMGGWSVYQFMAIKL